jgi:uncharacterized protein YbjT (DUF2867 family)
VTGDRDVAGDQAAIAAPHTPAVKVAVAGASGYVGSRLVERLAVRGHAVVALARHPQPNWPGNVEAVAVDVGDTEATAAALQGVKTAFYLVHALAEGDDFAERDRRLATSFAHAAQSAGVERIVYLGGLGREALSAHLASRQDVGVVLQESGIPVVELRAAVILGAGSISFEMLRSLTERLPVMVCPRWVRTRLQPLAESDLLGYLEGSLAVAPGIYEIGTPDVTQYLAMMRGYAEARGLRRRLVLTIPLLTPSLSARWVDLVSPVDRRVSHALIESLVNEVLVREPVPAATFSVVPMPVRAAIVSAINDEAEAVAAHLFDRPAGLHGGVYTVRHVMALEPHLVPAVSANLARVGGDLAWYGLAAAWRLRIALGWPFGERLRLARPKKLETGAVVDWWTVARHDIDHLVLASTGWFFGEGWLGYRLTSSPPRMEQVAAFRPKGLPGLAYWRILWPIHFVVFRVMARGQVHRARARAAATTSGPPPSTWLALWARARHCAPVRADQS